MVDREKVIKGLECCLAVTKCGTCPYNIGNDLWCGNNDQLLEDSLALLKAQEPVKPTRYQEGRWFKTWRCGACGGTLVFRNGKDKPKYCIDCGRAVKWDG